MVFLNYFEMKLLCQHLCHRNSFNNKKSGTGNADTYVIQLTWKMLEDYSWFFCGCLKAKYLKSADFANLLM